MRSHCQRQREKRLKSPLLTMKLHLLLTCQSLTVSNLYHYGKESLKTLVSVQKHCWEIILWLCHTFFLHISFLLVKSKIICAEQILFLWIFFPALLFLLCKIPSLLFDFKLFYGSQLRSCHVPCLTG